ncbi:MAG TPA: zinc ribbon domain-containing protein [Thermoanaerobaculia bacterium]|nr:zinc ribbon domain-containing protein [Thermoanaerobaculia bacterium]HUM29990.1 zinc ribbon domain-containing protein [Thermoanaerobaculia bacterium]HXK68321.1 zinc ribbon domain-containing protein [Thermoanaerobaculia bacterium]
MPVYEYKCRSCNHIDEHLVSMGQDPDSLVCSACGSKDMAKIFSVSNVSSGPNSMKDRPMPCQTDRPYCDPGSCCGGGGCSHD